MIDTVFVKVLNMSFIASYVVLAIVLIRLILKKSPKIYSYMLWGIVFLRMICPFTLKSIVSWVPINNNSISQSINYIKSSKIHNSIGSIDSTVNNVVYKNLPSASEVVSVNIMQRILYIASIIWIVGIIIILLYSIISYIRFYNLIRNATIVEENIYETDRITIPFVFGFVKPKIYLPLGIKDKSYEYIVNHEKTHIKRKDYIIKPIYFMAVVFHWFNPFMWLSYYLMTKDMEMACDEKVMKLKGHDIKADYAKLLFDLSVKQSNLLSPIAFGENNTKSRIRNIMNYKKPKFWVTVVTIVLVSIISIVFVTDPKSVNDEPDLSFLNIKNVAKNSALTDKLIAKDKKGISKYIEGKEFANLLYDNMAAWKEKKVKSNIELASTFTIYLNSGISQICFYDTEPVAKVIYKDDYRYYSIPKDFYNKVYMLYAPINYTLPNDLINIIIGGKKTNILSVNETPVNIKEYYSFSIADETYYIYKQGNKYYCESPYQFVKEISEDDYNKALKTKIVKKYNSDSIEDYKVDDKIVKLVEGNLEKIMSSPKESSNPRDYIKANDVAYEDIIKYGGEDALFYMLEQFKKGNVKGLRGEIMMILCKELLGVRNNVDDDTLSAEQWFKQLKIREKVELLDFEYQGNDPIEKLVYRTLRERHKIHRDSFMIVAPHIFENYEEDDKLKVFATIKESHYKLYDKFLSYESGSVVPVAITYVKNSDGNYILEEYKEAMDGAYFKSSIEEFCVMPVSGKRINGLADKIMKHYSNYKDILELERKNLIEHLKKHNQYGVSIQREYYNKPDVIIPIT